MSPVADCLRLNLPEKSSLLLAVSGGIDSMVLLDCCANLKDELGLGLAAAHLDHGLRDQSKSDAEFVKSECGRRDIELHIKTLAGNPRGTNREAWGRKERYAFFNILLKQNSIDWIVTAHQANDQVETLLIKLFSNKQLLGIEARDEKRRLLRPLLSVWRHEIDNYANKNKVVFCDDQTNTDLSMLRNKIRHETIPALTLQHGPGLLEILKKQADNLHDDIKTMYRQLEPGVLSVKSQEFGSKAWRRCLQDELEGLPKGLHWRFIEELLLEKLGFRLGKMHSLRALRVMMQQAQSAELPGGFRLALRNGGVAFDANPGPTCPIA